MLEDEAGVLVQIDETISKHSQSMSDVFYAIFGETDSSCLDFSS